MQIVFVSNYINHHQTPVSDELFRLTNGSYTFIQTEPMEEERLKMGWSSDAENKPYVRIYADNPKDCDALIMNADCVIFGGTEKENLIIPRLEANLFTIRYSERLYKEGRWKFISPRGLIKKYHDHIRFNKNNVYLLCSGAYVAGDFNLIHAYPHKKLKYGYFPEFVEYSDVHKRRKENSKTEILWAARFIDWKHPEIMIELAKYIKENEIDAHITMIGNGEIFEDMVKKAKGLEDIICFIGSKTPEEVREYMLASNVFVSTSDHKEGWGAVVNEAMNSGCVTIAAKDIGAAPYMIVQGESGYMYKACDIKALCKLISELSNNKEKQYLIGDNAYLRVKKIWNAKVAAERLFDFVNDNNHDVNRYKEGPLSKA